MFSSTRIELAQLSRYAKNDETVQFIEELEKWIGYERILKIGKFDFFPCKKQDWQYRVTIHFHGDWYIVPTETRLLLVNVVENISLTVAVYIISTNYVGWQYYYDMTEFTTPSGYQGISYDTGLSRAFKALEEP